MPLTKAQQSEIEINLINGMRLSLNDGDRIDIARKTIKTTIDVISNIVTLDTPPPAPPPPPQAPPAPPAPLDTGESETIEASETALI